jgi:hypothetical protein
VPPLAVCNAVFREGFRSCGFNGDTHWEPFELTQAEYEEFAHALVATAGYRRVEAPEWIETEIDWQAYVSSVRYGIPLERYRKLLYKFDKLVEKQQAARDGGNRLMFLVTTARLMTVFWRMQRLLARYVEHAD